MGPPWSWAAAGDLSEMGASASVSDLADDLDIEEVLALQEHDDGDLAARIRTVHCVGPRSRQFLFGGVAMALAVKAIERRIGGAPRWLTLQFIETTFPGETLSFSVERLIGRNIAQVALRGRVGERVVLVGMASVGSKPDAPEHQSAMMPDAPAPQDCPLIRGPSGAEGDAHRLLELRLVRGRFGMSAEGEATGEGRVLVWMRPQEGPVDAAMLAIMADFVPSVTADALGVSAGGTSLDNTLRILKTTATDWVLCEILLGGIHGGVAHGQMSLFAQDGSLLASASQSYLLRLHPQPPSQARTE